MPNIALVKTDGTVAAVYTGQDNAYSDGIQYGDHMARILPDGSNADEVLDCWFWNDGWHQQDTPTQNLDVIAIPMEATLVIE